MYCKAKRITKKAKIQIQKSLKNDVKIYLTYLFDFKDNHNFEKKLPIITFVS